MKHLKKFQSFINEENTYFTQVKKDAEQQAATAVQTNDPKQQDKFLDAEKIELVNTVKPNIEQIELKKANIQKRLDIMNNYLQNMMKYDPNTEDPMALKQQKIRQDQTKNMITNLQNNIKNMNTFIKTLKDQAKKLQPK